jgi:hypothetical protein
MRHVRILTLLALIIFLPSTLAAAPQQRRTDPSRFAQIVRVIKRFIAIIDSRITIPVGETDPNDPPSDDPPPPPNP